MKNRNILVNNNNNIIIIIIIIIIISLFYIATISIVFNTALHDLNIYTHELQKYKYIYIK